MFSLFYRKTCLRLHTNVVLQWVFLFIIKFCYFINFAKKKNERRRRSNARVVVMRTKISQTFFHRAFANFGKFFFHSLQSFFFFSKNKKKVGQKKLKNSTIF